MHGRICERHRQGSWQPLAPGERFDLAEGALQRTNVAAEEDIRGTLTGLDVGVRIACRSARTGLWLLVRRRGAIGTPRATLDWLSAAMLATSVSLRGGPTPARITRDPQSGAVRTFDESDFAVVWLVANAAATPPTLDDNVPARFVGARETVDVAGEAVLLSEAGGDTATLWIDPPGCRRVAATGAPWMGPGLADAASRVLQARAATSLTGLCDALAEGRHRAFALRHGGARPTVIGTAPAGRWTLAGPDETEVELPALTQLPRSAALLCLAADRTPWATVQVRDGDERVSLVFPLPPGGVAPVLDTEVASRLATLLHPLPRVPFSPWNDGPTAPLGAAWRFDAAAWSAYVDTVGALTRARSEHPTPSDLAAVARESLGRIDGVTLPPGALGDLLHALALARYDESLSAAVAAAEIVSVLAPVGRQRLTGDALSRALRAAMRCPVDPRGDDQLPPLVRALRAQAKLPEGDLDACAKLAGRLAKDKRFKALVVVARVAVALAPSRADPAGRVVALSADDAIALPCARTHAAWFEETLALPDDEQVAARVLDYAPALLPTLRAQAGAARCRAVAEWLDARFSRAWSEQAQAALRG